MINNLHKRIISSVILVILLLIILNLQNSFFLIFLFIILSFSIFEWKKLSPNIFQTCLGGLFIFFSFYSVYAIKFINDLDNLFYFVLFSCIVTDLGGFIFGRFFGGPKLTSISPNKTYSGAIGSLIFTIIFGYIYLNILNISVFNYNSFNLEYSILLIFTSLVSQLGDLSISYFKRISGVKDTGNLIPGHGGILDRIDGMIFAFPFIFITATVVHY